ncbi:MAG TPA: GatB/YqeY domain-containing protein [Spirochaetota bacterium]|nr:GatB/YqeY domain-containing protein [Spirochaetota bacterium]
MSILQNIESDLKSAIKNKDEIIVSTLRMLKSDIAYEKARGSEDLNEDQVLEIVNRAAKRRKESITEYEKADRDDLAEKERTELSIVQRYLPAQMSETEIESAIDDIITSMGEVSQKDFGKIMGQLMKDLKGKADGTQVKSILQKKL